VGELASWTGLVFALCLGAGFYLHDTGVDGPDVVPAVMATFAGLATFSAVAGVRQQRTAWWTSLVYSVSFAVVAGWVLVALIGPDSGTQGACSPGEMCDMDQGVGFFAGVTIAHAASVCRHKARRPNPHATKALRRHPSSLSAAERPGRRYATPCPVRARSAAAPASREASRDVGGR
jgi:hypothetical protein